MTIAGLVSLDQLDSGLYWMQSSKQPLNLSFSPREKDVRLNSSGTFVPSPVGKGAG